MPSEPPTQPEPPWNEEIEQACWDLVTEVMFHNTTSGDFAVQDKTNGNRWRVSVQFDPR